MTDEKDGPLFHFFFILELLVLFYCKLKHLQFSDNKMTYCKTDAEQKKV